MIRARWPSRLREQGCFPVIEEHRNNAKGSWGRIMPTEEREGVGEGK